MDWLWEILQFMSNDKTAGGLKWCSGAQIIDRLCKELQTGYSDIEDSAVNLVKVAEMAWLKQVSAWVLYGRLPSFGQDDFFIEMIDEQTQVCSNFLS